MAAPITQQSNRSVSTEADNGQSYRGPFAIMTFLFFMWGFMTVWNDILIPRFKEAFMLTCFQAMLVQFAFFGAFRPMTRSGPHRPASGLRSGSGPARTSSTTSRWETERNLLGNHENEACRLHA